MARDDRNLTRMEILSAWLGLWKPRDVEVPPVPKRKLAIGGAVLIALLLGAALLAVPAIRSGKDQAAEREGREAAEARAAERRRLEAEQVAHRGRGDASSGAGLLAGVRESILADARGRVRAGQLDGTILRVECEAGRRAFAVPGTLRVWVHTCTLDGPHALANYRARGFVPFHTETLQA